MIGDFVCVRYRLTLEATGPLRLNAFAGSTLRGGFGHVFKRSVCVWAAGDCGRCLLNNTCSYPYIFETSPPPGSEKLRGIAKQIHAKRLPDDQVTAARSTHATLAAC